MDTRRVTNAAGWPLKRANITRVEVTVARRKGKLSSCYKSIKKRLDPGNQTLATLDFRHLSQKLNEPVSDFIGRLEKVFQIGFGQENLSKETREM